MSRARTLCADCDGLGSAVLYRGTDEQGRRYIRLARDRCKTCNGTGHREPKQYAGRWGKTGKAEDGVRAESLGKLLGLNTRPKRTVR